MVSRLYLFSQNWYQDAYVFTHYWYQDFVYFHWYLLIYFFQLVSRFYLFSHNWYQCLFYFQLVSKNLICFIEKIQNFLYIRNIKNVLIYILIIERGDIKQIRVETPLLILCFGQKGGAHCFVFTLTPLLMIDKKGEKYFSIYACFPCFIHKGGEGFMFMHICFVLFYK